MHLLEGVTVPVVTTLDTDLAPDPEATYPLLDALADAGITRLMFLGTNGEGALLNPHHSGDYLIKAIAHWWDVVGPEATATATAFGAGTRETINRARIFADAGPDAIVVAPPYYFVHPHYELFRHYAALADLRLPIIAYNAPKYTGNAITTELLSSLANLEHIIGIKDSGGDDALIGHALTLRAKRPGFGVSQGNERRMAWALREGADGITPGLGNLAPAACSALATAVRDGDDATADRLQAELIDLMKIHQHRGGVAAMKAALHTRGLSTLQVSAPLQMYREEEVVLVQHVLDAWPGQLLTPRSR